MVELEEVELAVAMVDRVFVLRVVREEDVGGYLEEEERVVYEGKVLAKITIVEINFSRFGKQRPVRYREFWLIVVLVLPMILLLGRSFVVRDSKKWV